MDGRAFSKARDILRRARSVAVFSGAGLSAESGVSTFRGATADAFWSRYDPAELASPEGFAANPERVIDWYNWRRSALARAAPNAAHIALAAQAELLHVTQNVDDLLERAGVAEPRIQHLHGVIGKDRCHAQCGYEEAIDLAHPPSLRTCPRCEQPMRPAVVWFGERLPTATWLQAEAICASADCLLVIGTSATVYPATALVDLARARGSRIVVVNTQSSDTGYGGDAELIGRAGTVLPELLDGLALRTGRSPRAE